MLTLTYRRDGSSRFSKNNRWGDFPSAAFAWKVYEEPFMKNSKTFSNLKLRLSWGITGQQDISDNYYPYIPTYLASTNTAQYQLGNTYYTTFRAQPFNTTLKWEQTETYNTGLDFGLFDGIVNGSVDAYYRKTKDLLAFVPFPAGSSLSNADNANIGKMENKGIEVTLNSKLVNTDDLQLNVSGNFTWAHTEITKLRNNDPNYEGERVGGFTGGVGNTIQRHTVGYAPYSFFVYQQVYDTAGKPIEGVYVDRNHDGQITSADRYHYKKPAADYNFGFTTNLNYKNWNFNMAWRGSFGNYVYNNVDSNLGFQDHLLNAAFPNVINNGVVNVLETGFINGGANRYLSDYYIQEASFVKLDNVSVSYNFGNVMGESTNFTLSGTVQNVLTITDYKGLDPEVSGGIDYNIYPRPIVYMVGVNLNF